MRLLLVASEPLDPARGSGTAMAIRRLRDALADAGCSVPLLTPEHAGVSATAGRWRFNHRTRARAGSYDAVLGIGGDGWRVARELQLPFIALIKALYSRAIPWERGAVSAALRMHARWEGEGARRAAAVIVPSRHTADAVSRDYHVDAARIRVIPEPFDGAAWVEALPRRVRDGRRVLCVAHLYPRKRVGDLIAAWRQVQSVRQDAQLHVAGGGPELRRLARQVIDLPSVYLHGHVAHPGILELYARASAFALPSAQETFGYAVVEAMASGLPLVVAAAGSLPEMIAGAEAAAVEPGDTVGLAAALLRSLEPSRRPAAAVRNPQRVAAFDPRSVAASVMDTVRSLAF